MTGRRGTETRRDFKRVMENFGHFSSAVCVCVLKGIYKCMSDQIVNCSECYKTSKQTALN